MIDPKKEILSYREFLVLIGTSTILISLSSFNDFLSSALGTSGIFLLQSSIVYFFVKRHISSREIAQEQKESFEEQKISILSGTVSLVTIATIVSGFMIFYLFSIIKNLIW